MIAQAVLQRLRSRLDGPVATWDATHFAAKEVLYGLDGDRARNKPDTIVVTYYNAPNAELLRHHYQVRPARPAWLAKDGSLPENSVAL